MRNLAIIVWLILGIFYWWVWDTNSADCCNPNEVSGVTSQQKTAPAMSDAETKEMESAKIAADAKAKKEADELAAVEAAKAIEAAEKSNEVTAVKSTDAKGAQKLTFYFPYNSPNAKYSATTERDLNDLIKSAKASGKTISITGHTDSKGDAQNNMVLGQQRADQIKNRLISGGLSSGKILAKSQGQNVPVATNSTAAGRQQNRRVELIIE